MGASPHVAQRYVCACMELGQFKADGAEIKSFGLDRIILRVI